jgi:hypothetical protein
MLSQGAAVNLFCKERTIGELESNFVVEFPFVGSVRVESQGNAADRDIAFHGVALDL